MKKYTLAIGLFDKDAKIQVIDTVQAYKIVNNFVTSFIGYGTIKEAKGIYTHENGEVVIEPTLTVEVLATEEHINDDTIEKLAGACKKALNQESVLIEVSDVNARFF